MKNIDSLLQIQNSMKETVGAIRISGSAALDLAYMAAGRTDAGWVSNIKLWDVAAGMLLIQEAGGLISDSAGNPDCMNSDSLIFGNAKCFKEWLKLVSKPA